MASQRSRRIAEAQQALTFLGLPVEQRNERAALALLALLDLTPTKAWSDASSPLCGVTPIMEFAARHYGKKWKPNTRETVRRFTLHQFAQAGLAIANPDQPDRPTNSPRYCYQIAEPALFTLRQFGAEGWEHAIREYLAAQGSLAERYAQRRQMQEIPLAIDPELQLRISPGGQNELIARVIAEFCPRFTPGGELLYLGDTASKWAHFDAERLSSLGVSVSEHGKMPDLVVYDAARNWLVLIEAVTSHGPINPKRLVELKLLFANCRAGLVFVTAFLDRGAMLRYLSQIAWETEVWAADSPEHMIHFNGERFLGPY